MTLFHSLYTSPNWIISVYFREFFSLIIKQFHILLNILFKVFLILSHGTCLLSVLWQFLSWLRLDSPSGEIETQFQGDWIQNKTQGFVSHTHYRQVQASGCEVSHTRIRLDGKSSSLGPASSRSENYFAILNVLQCTVEYQAIWQWTQ